MPAPRGPGILPGAFCNESKRQPDSIVHAVAGIKKRRRAGCPHHVARASCPEPSVTKASANLTVLGVQPAVCGILAAIQSAGIAPAKADHPSKGPYFVTRDLIYPCTSLKHVRKDAERCRQDAGAPRSC